MNKSYYQEMLQRGRLMPIIVEGRCLGFITFYICNDVKEYVESDPWAVLDDYLQGKICYIAQLLTDEDRSNPKIFMKYWNDFKKEIKLRFPSVKIIYWRRWNKKTEKLIEHIKII